ncbi:MAG: Nif3-like dinuclear metal center hexameric protein [Clostridia bacterium]|nr:Nif3-like dinuclear metal center hexameric protein [Clostridia bacterium]
MGCEASRVIEILEEIAPSYLAESWDNSGLQIGSRDIKVAKIMVALDLTFGVVRQAEQDGVDMIVTHHPFLFDGVKSIDLDTFTGKLISRIIKNDIVVYSAHTNLDIAPEGVNQQLANIFKLKETQLLYETYSEEYFKLVVFVPEGYQDDVRSAITEQGAGWVGNYSGCTFQMSGMGTFIPMQGTSPFIGKQGKLEKVKEYRMETIVRKRDLYKVIDAMIKSHPYEEVAYDVYPLKNKLNTYGLGKIGKVHHIMNLKEYAEFVKNQLNIKSLNVAGNMEKSIKKVAVCGGSGSSLIDCAVSKNADLFITGDIKYHDAQRAVNSGLCIIDAGHYNTEVIILPFLINYLKKFFKEQALDVEVVGYSGDEQIIYNL